MPRSRRALLRTVGVAAVGIAGCTGSSDDQPRTTGPTDTRTTTTSHGTPEQTGDPPEPEHVPPTLAWRARVEGSADSRPTISDSTVYVPAADLFAFALDGTRRWRYRTTGSVWDIRQLPSDGVLALTGQAESAAGGTFAVVAVGPDGTKRWRFAPESPFLELLAVTNETAYVGSYTDVYHRSGHHLWAVDLATGRPRWEAEIGGPSTAVVDKNTIYVGNPGIVRTFETSTGNRRWHSERPKSQQFVHGVAKGGLVVEGNSFASLATDTGSERWVFGKGEDTIPTGGNLAEGAFYAATYDQVHALDPADGSKRWTAGRYAGQADVPLVADGTAYAAGENLIALASDSGREKWRFETGTPAWTVQPTPKTLVTGNYRSLYALARDGSERWRFVSGAQLGAIGAGEGWVVAGDEQGSVYAFKGGRK